MDQPRAMLEHLIDFEPDVEYVEETFQPLAKATVAETIDAKVKVVDWLKEIDVATTKEIVDSAQIEAARLSFTNIINAAPQAVTKETLAEIKSPAAVQHLVGMLTAFDWEFIHQAQEIRGYCVAQLLEETKNSNANIRIKALTALGKVTEIGLFTDKIEVKQAELSDDDIEQRIKAKLHSFMKVVDVIDAKDVIEYPANEIPPEVLDEHI